MTVEAIHYAQVCWLAERKINMKLIPVIFFLSLTLYAKAQQTDTLKYCVRDDLVGVGGYDPVSYFKSKKPVLGNDKIHLTHDGVKYKFASNENKKLFSSRPEAYLPQFGGWCSMTLVMGRATRPVYENFLISEGRLYLFERTLSVNGKELWLNNPIVNEKIAIKNYTSYKDTGKIQ